MARQVETLRSYVTTNHQAVDVDALFTRLRSDEVLMKAASEAAHNQGPANNMLPEAEIRRHVTAIMDAVAAALSGDATEIARTQTKVDDLAIDRLEQGISLRDVLQGFRLARFVLVARLVTIGEEMFGSDALLPLLAPMDAVVGEVQERMILTYQSGEQDLLRSRRSTQVEALRELLGGGSLEWAAEAGLQRSGRYHCLIADVSIPREARRLEQSWASPHGVSGVVHGYLCRVTVELPPVDEQESLVIVSPRVPVDELAETYALCRQALSMCLARCDTGRLPLLGAAQDMATSAIPMLGRLLAREQLANLDPGNDFHRELATTASTYIANGKHVDEAAASLHIHANTLRYRLRRFNELTIAGPHASVSDRSLASNLHTWWALKTWLDEATRPRQPSTTPFPDQHDPGYLSSRPVDR